jgi:hypothetical protein
MRMLGKPLKSKAKRPILQLTPRDIEALSQIHLHRAMTSTQLARLCFPDVTYETSRKRIRKLKQGGILGAQASERIEGRGRPEYVFYLTQLATRELERYANISSDEIAYGPPHTYHVEHLLKLVDMRLALEEAQRKKLISEYEWQSGGAYLARPLDSQSANNQVADATISYTFPGKEKMIALLEVDTGNLRQGKHWEPKLRRFLQSGFPIWVVTLNSGRMATLRAWTEPLLAGAKAKASQCLFAVFDDIAESGIFAANWYDTAGKITPLTS